MHERGIYDFSKVPMQGFTADWVENLLGEFDARYNDVASRTIDQMIDPSKKDALTFAICGYHQLLRSPVAREYLAENNKEILTSNPKAKGIVDNFGGMLVAGAIKFLPGFIDSIRLTLWKTTGPVLFHSSDNPMTQWYSIKGTMYHASSREVLDTPFDHKFFFYPLSPHYLLEMYPRIAGHGQSFEVISAPPDAVNMYNGYIEQGAQRFILLPQK